MWDTQRDDQIHVSLKHEALLTQALFGKDETQILTWNADTVRLWDISAYLDFPPTNPRDRKAQINQ